MKQSNNNKKSRDVTAFLYERLSRDDNMDGESYSIGNQKKLLIKVAKEKGYTNLVHFFDDGISGVTMDRPGFADMIQQLEQRKAAAVFVKDLSRLGRNYIEVGRLTEEFFPNHDIRLVAVSDNIDTDEGENELAPIRNLFNEWYARDISKKRRISNKIKGNAGEPMGQPPYGYIKDPENPKRWIVDEEAAQVVRRIYRMTLEGGGTEQIAAKLEEDGILTPRAYWHSKGINRPGKVKDLPPTHCNSSSVINIYSLYLQGCGQKEIARKLNSLGRKTPAQIRLERLGYDSQKPHKTRDGQFLWTYASVKNVLVEEVYTGVLVNHRREYLGGKARAVNETDWLRHENFYPVIIEKATWQQVQIRLKQQARPAVNNRTKHRYAGLLTCRECGNTFIPMIRCWNGKSRVEYVCRGYHRNGKAYCASHRIHEEVLDAAVQAYAQTVRKQCAEELKKLVQMQKMWALRKPILDAHILSLQEKVQVLEQEIDEIVMEKIIHQT